MTPLVLFLLTIHAPADSTHRLVAVAPAETLHIVVSGEGQPVVLVPGLLGAGYGFRKVVPLLNEAGFRTYVIDLLGTGESAYPRDADYSLDAQADRIAAASDSLGVTRAIFIAHAIGGSVTMRLATRRPDLVAGLVLVEAGAAESATSPGLRRALKLRPLIRLLGVGSLRGRIRDQLRDASGDPAWVDGAVVHGYTAGAQRDLGATLRALEAMSKATERSSLAANLPSIQAPVLLLLGGVPHAGAPPVSEIELMARSLPSFAADTLAGIGHFPHEENPQAVTDAVLRLHRAALAMPVPVTG